MYYRYGFKTIARKIGKAILSLFIAGALIANLGVAMDEGDLSEETALILLSTTISPETWERFFTYCPHEKLNERIIEFIFINKDFITNVELSDFEYILENMNSKMKAEQIVNDEVFAQAIFNQKPISLQIQCRFLDLESGTDAQKSAVVKFRDILAYRRENQKIPNLDVHFFDNYIFGTQKKILDLIDFGNLLHIDQGGLTLAQVGVEMKKFIDDHPNNFIRFTYFSNQVVAPETLKGYLGTHFSNMDSEVAILCPAAQIIWSKAWTLAKLLYEQEDDGSAITIIFGQVCESYLTQGGCIEGRINRGFEGYFSLLTKCGIK